jgi:hypothetical protein
MATGLYLMGGLSAAAAIQLADNAKVIKKM